MKISKNDQLIITNIDEFRNKSQEFLVKNTQENFVLTIIQDCLQEAFNDNFGAIILKIENLPLIYQNFIFYNSWCLKGKIMGVSDEFGKLALFNSSKIAKCYHYTKEEFIDFLLGLSQVLETFDKMY